MPNLTPDQIKVRIAEGSIFAISIDTEVFDGLPGKFDNAVLRRLDQFNARDTRVVFSEVVASEIKRHVASAAKETQRELKKALRQHTLRWKLNIRRDAGDPFAVEADADAFATAQFDAFLESVNGEIAKSATVPDISTDVLDRYFSEAPPFGESDKRKHEFPDAFALLSLEAFARDADKLLLCVTADKGWLDFCAASDHLVCVTKLEEALSYFNDVHQALSEVVVDAWRANAGGDIADQISKAFEHRLGELNFHATADADAEFESEPIEATFQSLDPQSIGLPITIAADDDTVTFTVPVEALVEFTAAFHFFVYDSVDKDYISLGSEEATVEKEIQFDLTITADRVFEEAPVFHDVEVASNPFGVHFEYVEAFPRDDPEHERY